MDPKHPTEVPHPVRRRPAPRRGSGIALSLVSGFHGRAQTISQVCFSGGDNRLDCRLRGEPGIGTSYARCVSGRTKKTVYK